MKPIKLEFALVDENDEQTRYTLFRAKTGEVWVTTWEVSRQGYGGLGSTFRPKDFDSVMVEGRSLRALVDEALREIDGAAVAAKPRKQA